MFSWFWKTDPIVPTDQIAPNSPTDQIVPTDQIASNSPTDPIVPTDQIAPNTPTDAIASTDPTGSKDPIVPTDSRDTIGKRVSLPTELEQNRLFRRKKKEKPYSEFKCKIEISKRLTEISNTVGKPKKIILAQQLFDLFLLDEYRFFVRNELRFAKTIYDKAIELSKEEHSLKLEPTMRAMFPNMPSWVDCLQGAAFDANFTRVT